MSEWIDVKDSLPEQGAMVWVVCDGTVQHSVYYLSGKEWSSWFEDGDPMPLSAVSRWMYLPEPPKVNP